MTEVDELPHATDEEMAGWIREFRETLLNAGYHHATGAGELASADGTTWIGTSYTHGEFTIHAWRRPKGYGEVGERRPYTRILGTTDPATVVALGKRLARWAKKPPTRGNTDWPVPGLELPVSHA